MKKIILLFFAAILLSSLFACTPAEEPLSEREEGSVAVTDTVHSTQSETNVDTSSEETDYVLGYNDFLGRYIYKTDEPPEELITFFTLGQADGHGGWDVIYYKGELYAYNSRKEGTVRELPEDYALVGKTKDPVYPWVVPEEEFVSNCLFERTDVYYREKDGVETLAVPYMDMFPMELRPCYKIFWKLDELREMYRND